MIFKNFFKKDELKHLSPFYLVTLIRSIFWLISGYAIIYFLDQGLSFFQITILMSLSSIMAIIFDIPTGAVADIYGRKVSVTLSYFISGILILLIPISSNFYYLLTIFALWGISDTLYSGAIDAWIVSHLKQKRKNDLIENYYVHNTSLENIGTVVGPLLAVGTILLWGMDYLWVIQGIATIAVGTILIFIKENFKREKSHIKETFRQTIDQSKKSISYGLKHPVVLKLLIAGFFLAITIGSTGYLWQPYLKSFNVPLPWFGYLLSATGLLAIFVPKLSQKLSQKFEKRSKYLATVALAFMFILFTSYLVASKITAMLIIVPIYLAIMFILPVEMPFFQRFLPNKLRATVGSFKSMIQQTGFAISAIGIGAIAELFGIKNAMAIIGFALIPSIYYYFKINK